MHDVSDAGLKPALNSIRVMVGLPQRLSLPRGLRPGSPRHPPGPTSTVLLGRAPAVEGGAARGEAQGLPVGLRALLRHELQLGLLAGLVEGGRGQAREGPGQGAWGRGLRQGTLAPGESKAPGSARAKTWVGAQLLAAPQFPAL